MKALLAVAAIVVMGAIAVSAFVWGTSGSAAPCDPDQLAAAMRDSIQAAERQGDAQASVNLPEACDEEDMAEAMPAVSRTWHVMPGGMLMRAAEHSDP